MQVPVVSVALNFYDSLRIINLILARVVTGFRLLLSFWLRPPRFAGFFAAIRLSGIPIPAMRTGVLPYLYLRKDFRGIFVGYVLFPCLRIGVIVICMLQDFHDWQLGQLRQRNHPHQL